MFFAAENFSDDHIIKFAGLLLNSFNLDPEHGQALRQFLWGPGEIDVILQPIQRDFHGAKLKLPEETDIILIKQTDIVNLVTDHGDAFDAETEGPAGPDFGIVSDVFE